MRWARAPANSAAAIAAVAERVHRDHPEREAVFADRLALYPAGCLLLAAPGSMKALGYALSHPWRSDLAIMLDTEIGRLPASPDCFYLHDIALLPETRGRGLGEAGLAAIEAVARDARLPQIALVALPDALAYWTARNFQPAGKRAHPSYGAGAQYLAKRL